MEVIEVVPGLSIGTKLVPPADYDSLGIDAIVDLEAWDYAWAPDVPDGSIYLSFPLVDGGPVDPKVPLVAGFVVALLRDGRRVLVHCTEGLNRSGLVIATALMEMGWSAVDAIELVRERRGPTDDEMYALGNEAFVAWLLARP
jgi:protein-tyrosine phosphatase